MPLKWTINNPQVNARGKARLVNGWTTASWSTNSGLLTYPSSRSKTNGTRRGPNQFWTTFYWGVMRECSMCTRFMIREEVEYDFFFHFGGGWNVNWPSQVTDSVDSLRFNSCTSHILREIRHNWITDKPDDAVEEGLSHDELQTWKRTHQGGRWRRQKTIYGGILWILCPASGLILADDDSELNKSK